jgi:hypothetical protein
MTPDHNLAQYRTLLTKAIEECQLTQRPARAAWLMHCIRREIPSFKLSDLGLANFKELLNALGGFTVTHDGYDIVASLGAGEQAAEKPRNNRFEKVHPALWRVLVGQTKGPMYLDLKSLNEAKQVVLKPERPEGDAGWVEVPVASGKEQADWLLSWSEKSASADLVTSVRSALDLGGVQSAIMVLRQRGLDHRFLIDRIEWSKDRLRQWLDANGLAWGSPIIETFRPPARSVAQPAASTLELRDVVAEALSRLPPGELRQLWLPVGLVYDVICEKRSG